MPKASDKDSTGPVPTGSWFQTTNPTHDRIMLAHSNTTDWLDSFNPLPQDSNNSTYSFLPDPSLDGTNVQQWIRASVSQPREIALALNLPLSDQFLRRNQSQDPTSLSPLRTHLNNLINELRLLGSLMQRRHTVTCLHWPSEMTSLLRPEEMTEILYHIHRQFNVRRTEPVHFVFELAGLPVNDSLIALARGLGFSEIFINDFDTLQAHSRETQIKFIKLLRRYGFRAVNARIHYSANASAEGLESSVQRAIDLGFDLISLAENPLYGHVARTSRHEQRDRGLDQRLTKRLLKRGYQQHGPRSFSSPRSLECLKPQAIFGVGLGGTSLMDQHYWRNTDQIDQYRSSLEAQQLPLCEAGQILLQSKA